VREPDVTKGEGTGQLLRILGVVFGLAAGIGGTIGVGILRTPGIVATQLHSAALILLLWALGPVYCLLCANVLAELATMLPKAGGPYVYVRRAFGAFAGFVFGWADWILYCGVLATLGVAFAEFLQQLAGSFTWSIGRVAVSVIALMTLIQLGGLRVGSWVLQWFSLIKVIGFLGIALACLLVPVGERAPHATPAMTSVEPSVWAAVAAFFLSWQIVQETYNGWGDAKYFSEENVNPGRSLPRALFGSVVIVAVVYLTLNIALLRVLDPADLAGSNIALADAAGRVLGEDSRRWVTVLALVSVVGILNNIVMLAPRILYAISRDGLFTKRAATVSAVGTPTIALLVTGSFAAFLAASGSFEALFRMVAFLGVSVQICYVLAFFMLRKREPALPRPYRAVLYPWLPALALIATAGLWLGSLVANPASALYGLGLVALSYPVYRVLRRRTISTGTPSRETTLDPRR